MKDSLTGILDFFYPPFKRFMPLQTFRYAACGGANTLLGLFIYGIGYQYIFDQEIFHIGFFAFKPHIAALLLSGIVTFTVGFLLSKYVVFTGSNMKGRVQLFRYFLTFFLNLCINYLMLKLLVELFGLNPLVSQSITIVVVVTISYLSQKHFTFRTKAES